ncbi:MAG TPA: FAD-binding oxidoreductase [Solirubrobacterales bacterium]|jgi:glycine/D-amino acid oxidase-like deaminating enzyme|nr:FAD-binding oxidoreductase [Solirubrobacterales bacterium]
MEHTRHGYWLEEAGSVPPAPPLAAAGAADVVIVGGGFTGLWAAWHIKQLEPEARVVLLEADGCGRGPSGRNGGFCNAMWFQLASMRRRWGDEPALAVARAAQEAVEGIGAFCEGEGVDAWFRQAGYMQVSTAAAHDGVLARALEACRELGAGERLTALSHEEVMARCAAPLFRAGAISPSGATVQPARLALGLRARLLARGVELHESSPVLAVRDAGSGVEARTAIGSVCAGAAVLAIGAAARSSRGPLHNRLSVASSHVAVTEPVPDLLEAIGWTGGECIIDGRALVDYFRTTPDGRIVFGWGGGRIAMGARLGGRSELDPEVVAAVAAHLHAFFPGLAGRAIAHAWGGPIDASPTHLPLVVPLAGGRAFVAAGYTGNGVGPSHMVGRTLASLALDRRDEPSRLAFVDPSPPRIPPEPFQWIGGEAIRAALIAKENAELAGRPPSLVSSALAGLPARIGFHIGR